MTEKASREKSLATNYAELYRLEQTGDYDRALKIANKILHSSPDEAVAFQCKVVCFIQSSKFDEALAFMKRNPQLSEKLHFEKAYCLYRSNRSLDALKEIEQAEELDFRLLELRAQVYYRIERFLDSFNEYQEIIKSVDDEYDNERETNMGAALTYAGVETIKKYSPDMRDDTYEVCFNKACQLISLGQYNEAEKKLRQCEKLCRDALEEDGSSEDEILLELAHARIQLGFVYQKQGRIREAQTLYLNSLKLKLEDVALSAVACNNAVVINKDQNVFDSKKKMKVATNDQLTYKLLEGQKKYIALNNALLHFYTNQFEQCKKLCDAIDKTWPDLITTTTVIRALVFIKNNDYVKALTLLEGTVYGADEEGKLYLTLCQVQLWLMQGNRQKACDILERSGIDRYRPGIVGALITLYLAEGKEEIAQKIYKETVEWYKVNKKGEGDLTNLWRQAAEFHIRNGQATVAADSLEELLRSNPNDTKTVGQLVVAYAEFDIPKAIKLGYNLFSIEEIALDLDIENVESSVWLSTKKVAPLRSDISPGSSTSLLDNGSNGRRKKKNHKKKGKLPKFVDPKIPPDPERWLPKYERTGFRKKRDRRVKDVIKGSQGTASGQAELFDFSGKSANDSEAQDSPSSVDPSPAARNQKAKSQQKKKNRRR